LPVGEVPTFRDDASNLLEFLEPDPSDPSGLPLLKQHASSKSKPNDRGLPFSDPPLSEAPRSEGSFASSEVQLYEPPLPPFEAPKSDRSFASSIEPFSEPPLSDAPSSDRSFASSDELPEDFASLWNRFTDVVLVLSVVRLGGFPELSSSEERDFWEVSDFSDGVISIS